MDAARLKKAEQSKHGMRRLKLRRRAAGLCLAGPDHPNDRAPQLYCTRCALARRAERRMQRAMDRAHRRGSQRVAPAAGRGW